MTVTVVPMKVPRLQGVIERRVLANYRLDALVTARYLPAPFRPQLVDGYAMGGICLIRLAKVRPVGVCDWIGIGSENAAHRFAVEWDEAGKVRHGVYVPRRDTDSRLNHWAGGRIFPGTQHLAAFNVTERSDAVSVALQSKDGSTRVEIGGRSADAFPADSVFGGLVEASAFFEADSLGYSKTDTPGVYDGLELACENWQCESLEVDCVHSSFFEDEELFPAGTAVFDHALLMRDIEHQWHSRDELCCD